MLCMCFYIMHSRGLSCLSGKPKNFSRKCFFLCVNTDCGMATDCALIGSFNNHPKWQTIGWIKYTCWLNYRCNIFTPTCTVFTNTYTHRYIDRHILCSHTFTPSVPNVWVWRFFVVISLEIKFSTHLSMRKKRRRNYVAYTHSSININEIDCRGSLIPMF